MIGTKPDLPMHSLRRAQYCKSVPCGLRYDAQSTGLTRSMVLRAAYAMSSTDVLYGATRMICTDVIYGATRAVRDVRYQANGDEGGGGCVQGQRHVSGRGKVPLL